ncbi:MAG: L-alanine-DL-glutamate epimerase-like enolase superfamily enzyme [Planctomycetota bacterium]|jgi:L-alanine-DL-glutamate epimerase-like enolase superfamily enzyme
MKIVDIRETTVSLASQTENADINFSQMTASAVVVTSDYYCNNKPLVGLGFDSIGRYGHGGLLRERFIPRILVANEESYQEVNLNNIDPEKIWNIVMKDEKPGGHGERAGAMGLLDAAIWDLVAKIEEKPLWQVLGERYNTQQSLEKIPVYISGGHYSQEDDIKNLKEDLLRSKDDGYKLFKIKIGGRGLADDCRRIEMALTVIGKPESLAVDVNCAINPNSANEYIAELDNYGLAWIEEPVDPLDFQSYCDISKDCKTSIGTGENIFSHADLQNLLRYGGLRTDRDYLQMDISLSYGIPEYMRMLALIEASGWSRLQCLPHAGHLFALHAVAGLGLGAHETAMDRRSPIAGFPAGMKVEDGYLTLPQSIGVGFEEKQELYDLFKTILK